MHNTSIRPTSWTKMSLAILPGLWIIVQQSEIPNQMYRGIGSTVLVIIALGIVGTSLIMERRLTAWSLPSLGALLWAGWEWVWWLINMRTLWVPWFTSFYSRLYGLFGVNPALLMWGSCLALTVVVPYFAYKKSGLHMPRLGWVLVSLTILATVAYICLYTLPYHWLSLKSMFRLSLLLTFVAIGFPLSKYADLAAGLFVVACEPAWFEMFFNPLYVIRIYAYDSPNSKLALALIVLSYLPFLCFLVVTPIGVLRSHSRRGQRWWLLLPSFLTLVSINVVRGFALQGTPAEYSPITWLRYGLAIFQLWLPLLLTAVLYTRQNHEACPAERINLASTLTPVTGKK